MSACSDVIPWQQLAGQTSVSARSSVISVFMQQIYGGWAGKLVTALIMWTAFGSVFSLLLGYSRVPYAAALDGNYFAIFGRLHPKHRFPLCLSAGARGGGDGLLCVAARRRNRGAGGDSHPLAIPHLQQVGLLILRKAKSGDATRPFRMWLYPLPALFAIAGFVYILFFAAEFPCVRPATR